MKNVFIILIWFFAQPAIAYEYRLLDVDRLDLEYTKLNPNNRDPYAPDYTGRWNERAAIKFDVSILGHLYWDNNVHTETIDNGQVKTVGWEWEAGFHLGKYFDVFQHHHSRHLMDEPPQRQYEYPSGSTSFPVENGYGIRFKFIPGKE